MLILLNSCRISKNGQRNYTPKQILLKGTIEFEFTKFSNYYCINNIYFHPSHLDKTDLNKNKYLVLPSRYYNYKIIKQIPSFEYYLGSAPKYYYSDSIYAYDLFNLKELGQKIENRKILYNSNSFYEKENCDSAIFLLFSIEARFVYYPNLDINKLFQTINIPEIPCNLYSNKENYSYLAIDSIINTDTILDSRIKKAFSKSLITSIKSPIIF